MLPLADRFDVRSIARAAVAASAIGALSFTPAIASPRPDAAMNYRLHCEGCHKDDGSGQPGFIPALRGSVGRFLSTPEGRTYLARVPGTAQSLLSDVERAEVLNWIVASFDPAHVPRDFKPYTPGELARWRYDALSQPGLVRAKLVSQLQSTSLQSAAPDASAARKPQTVAQATTAPPTTFAICAACHTVTPDGASGVGPNLRGVVGRKVGSNVGFTYSPAMSKAGFTWSAEALDEFLTSPQQKIPGNYMPFEGITDADERKAVVEYLATLR